MPTSIGRSRILSGLDATVSPADAAARSRPTSLAWRRQTWLHAALTVLDIVGNALCCSLVAWAITWLSAIGNPFVGQSPAAQSYRTFALSTFISSQLFYCAIGTGIQAAMLRSLHFRDAPERCATLWRCVWRVWRRASPFYLVSLVLLLGVEFALSTPSLRHLRPYRLDVYLGWSTCFVYTVGLGLVGRFVFKNETVEGQRSVVQVLRAMPAQAPPAMLVAGKTASFWSAWRRVVVVRVPIFAVGLGTVLYVHVLSSQRFDDEVKLVGLIMGSVFLKHLVQRLAKRFMLQTDVKSIRTMVIAVGPPTVLIDTQLRVILQRVDDTHITMRGAALMALLELAIRLVKARHTRHILLEAQAASVGGTTARALALASTSTATQTNKHLYVTRLLAFRAAALVADMSAEYIAMGCASAILFFYWNHDKYQLAETSTTPVPHSASATNRWDASQTLVFVAQAVVEIVVDVFSCSVEVSHGVTFDVVRQDRVYVALVFIATAIGSVIVTATTYLRAPPSSSSSP
ncbi:hypothetical protein P43SY_003330 [Pythium insidiosum]|uniref:Transmembrane protein n=1 Tax=Pythium insidiosum TaxID=114742 RepID=A0AAD5LFE7_PYTIN|nr:hypothetical protein P43SY_003330 [Pythium insidiosum]